MKKILLLSAFIGAAMSLNSCGGGAGVSTNATFGELPAYCANYEAKEQEIKKKGEAATSMDDLKNLGEESQEAQAQFDANVDAELEKVNGREVKYSFSDALKAAPEELFYEVTDKLALITKKGSTILKAKFTPKASKEIVLERLEGVEKTIYVKMTNSNGGAIYSAQCLPLSHQSEPRTIAKGEALDECELAFVLNALPTLWGDFEQVVFCTKAQYEAANAEISAARAAIKES